MNATFMSTDNSSAGRTEWDVVCGDLEMHSDLCFNQYTFQCQPNSTSLNGTTVGIAGNGTMNATDPVCRLEYKIDKVSEESNCTTTLTFLPQIESQNSRDSSANWYVTELPIPWSDMKNGARGPLSGMKTSSLKLALIFLSLFLA